MTYSRPTVKTVMADLPPNHPNRLALADEVHARPPESLELPCQATYVAVLVDGADREREREHVAKLCGGFDVAPPDAGVTQFSAQIGAVRLKWERHGEFSGYTFFAPGVSERPFNEPVSRLLPAGWLSSVPGQTMVGAHAMLVAIGESPPDQTALSEHFEGNIVVGAGIGGGAGYAFTDFRVHEDGFSRFVLLSRGERGLTPRQAGRMLQRLLEIESYRTMALLALPIARRQSPRIIAVERALAELTGGIAREDGDEETLLHELTRLAAEVESGLSASQFRFGATRAYAELVRTRITELREVRIAGIQTIEEFMARRFTPAVATCTTVSQRLHSLSERVAQASGLLATRVGIAREKQNQKLLASMDRRAKLQLRLQQTVEGLSVAAITYYLASLIGYLAKGAKSAGFALNAELIVGLSIPLLGVAALVAIRRVRRHVVAAERSAR